MKSASAALLLALLISGVTVTHAEARRIALEHPLVLADADGRPSPRTIFRANGC
jgi:hypothetical protein